MFPKLKEDIPPAIPNEWSKDALLMSVPFPLDLRDSKTSVLELGDLFFWGRGGGMSGSDPFVNSSGETLNNRNILLIKENKNTANILKSSYVSIRIYVNKVLNN